MPKKYIFIMAMIQEKEKKIAKELINIIKENRKCLDYSSFHTFNFDTFKKKCL
jgi:hypothetical protein